MMNKIIQLDALPFVLSFPERRRVRIVHAHGCFDILHVGHAEYLEQAKLHGDILVVTVTSDKFVNKGRGRPVFTQSQRMQMLSYLSFVDFVALSDDITAVNAIRKIQPNIYVKGSDYADKGICESERLAINGIGAKLVITTTEKYSTTEIIERLKA